MDDWDCFPLLVVAVEMQITLVVVLQVLAVDLSFGALDLLVEHWSLAFVCVADVAVVLIGVGTDKTHQTNCSILI